MPGDPVAGFLVVNNGDLDGSLALAVVACVCFYAGGLVMNDLADEAEDLRDRPERPLPSGAVGRKAAMVATVVLCASGVLALAATGRPGPPIMGCVLVAAMAAYNFLTKRWPVAGAVNMGACRALSVLVGGIVGPRASYAFGIAVPVALVFGLFIASVTNLARHEVRGRAPVSARLLPSLVMVLGCLGGIHNAMNGPMVAPIAALFALAAAATLWLAVKLFVHPAAPLPPVIGSHIRILLPLQAAVCYSGDPYNGEAGQITALLLVLAWPASWLASKRFYAS